MSKFRIRDKRESLELTLANVAERTKLDISTLSRIENNKFIPNRMQKIKIAKALECDPNDLLFPESHLAFGI